MQQDAHGSHEHGTHTTDHTGHAEHTDHTSHAGHSDHAGHSAGHEHHGHHGTGKVSWSMAAKATLHCLTGCAIGEVLGMLIGTALGWGNMQTMILAIVLAFFFGYALTLRGILAAGVDFRTAFKVALAADTLSIAVMEIIDNGVIALWPGAMDAHLDEPLFWIVLAIALAAAFVITTPVNKWMIGRGKGHAVVHQYHH
ncbi:MULTISPECIES: DUF4396 domain-containing protein [unclassified Streptomyces]|uniref:DUF4396 domain-containing protein n=1 Tax=unclassified Streptomyces TaxID=2593676 RepID=UPI0006F728D1|nr:MULTISPECIES: DUF4396 domain-containing protein [unclassified Streptomyces]KQX53341.1 hypothetical protein ASD33_09160 [Streptomyces sp. Root1304]KRA90261.1 hypothetical protein ASE09_09165 [Streptomyces sp. Root66D1]